jgi:hypothetical protein
MNTRMILASLVTAALFAACSSPSTLIAAEELGAQPTLDELNTDNDTSVDLAGSSGGLGKLVIRKIYDSNQNGKYDSGEAGIPNWGVRITSLYADGTPSQVSDIQVTPEGSQRWRGVVLNVVYGKYTIEELAPVGTNQAGTTWKVTGPTSRTVSVNANSSVRGVEFAGACLENGAVVPFPKLSDFYGWKCRANFDLLPRISSFTAEPNQIQSGGSSALKWNVLDYSSLEITPGIGALTGFTGSKNVSPSSTTAYTLKATNGFGSRSASVTVNVGTVGSSMKWQTPQVLSNAVIPANTPVLVSDGRDRIMFVVSSISTSNPDVLDLQANTYTASSGWSSFERIGQVKKLQESQTAFTTAIQARIARNGDAFVWTANDDGSTTVFRKPNAGNWDAGRQFNPGFVGTLRNLPVLETDASGNAFLLTAGCLDQIGVDCRSLGSLAARFTLPAGWSSLTALETNFVGSKMAVQPNGNAVVTGSSAIYNTDGLFIGYAPQIRAISFTASTGWSTSRIIETLTFSNLGAVSSLTSDATGVIRMIFNNGFDRCFTRFTAQTVEASQCRTVSGFGKSVINGQGLVLAAYNVIHPRSINTPYSDTVVTQFVPNSGWTNPQTLFLGTYNLSDNSVTGQFVYDLSINENGVGYLSSSQYGKAPLPDESSWRYSPQSGWKDTGTAWSASANGTYISTSNVLTLPNDTALAVGVITDINNNRLGLMFNTYR